MFGSNQLDKLKKLKKPKLFAQFRAVTWKRDRHGLFDNEAQNIEEVSHTTTWPGKICLQSEDKVTFEANKLQFATHSSSDNSIAIVNKDEKGFWIDHASSESAEEESVDKLWLLARHLENENGKYDYCIEKFDTIRVGRVRMRVKDFRCNGQQASAAELHA